MATYSKNWIDAGRIKIKTFLSRHWTSHKCTKRKALERLFVTPKLDSVVALWVKAAPQAVSRYLMPRPCVWARGRRAGHYEPLSWLCPWASSEYLLPDIPETMGITGENPKTTWIIKLNCHKYNQTVTVMYIAPRNKKKKKGHCPEVSEWALLPEITKVKCQRSLGMTNK